MVAQRRQVVLRVGTQLRIQFGVVGGGLKQFDIDLVVFDHVLHLVTVEIFTRVSCPELVHHRLMHRAAGRRYFQALPLVTLTSCSFALVWSVTTRLADALTCPFDAF
jgi:hypothetical protein